MPTNWPLIVRRVTLGVCVLAFFVTMRTPPGPLMLLHYISLIAAVGIAAFELATRFTPKWSLAIAIATGIVAAILWAQWDYYIKDWETRIESDDGRARYADYTYRGQSQPFYRSMLVWWDTGGYVHSEGGFSESGKQHGEWQSYSSKDFKPEYEWYWFGEPISEGEWHLRNK